MTALNKSYILMPYNSNNETLAYIEFSNSDPYALPLDQLQGYKKLSNKAVELGYIKGFKIIEAERGLVVYERTKA